MGSDRNTRITNIHTSGVIRLSIDSINVSVLFLKNKVIKNENIVTAIKTKNLVSMDVWIFKKNIFLSFHTSEPEARKTIPKSIRCPVLRFNRKNLNTISRNCKINHESRDVIIATTNHKTDERAIAGINSENEP